MTFLTPTSSPTCQLFYHDVAKNDLVNVINFYVSVNKHDDQKMLKKWPIFGVKNDPFFDHFFDRFFWSKKCQKRPPFLTPFFDHFFDQKNDRFLIKKVSKKGSKTPPFLGGYPNFWRGGQKTRKSGFRSKTRKSSKKGGLKKCFFQKSLSWGPFFGGFSKTPKKKLDFLAFWQRPGGSPPGNFIFHKKHVFSKIPILRPLFWTFLKKTPFFYPLEKKFRLTTRLSPQKRWGKMTIFWPPSPRSSGSRGVKNACQKKMPLSWPPLGGHFGRLVNWQNPGFDPPKIATVSWPVFRDQKYHFGRNRPETQNQKFALFDTFGAQGGQNRRCKSCKFWFFFDPPSP